VAELRKRDHCGLPVGGGEIRCVSDERDAHAKQGARDVFAADLAVAY
jgi:hypothetical protein